MSYEWEEINYMIQLMRTQDYIGERLREYCPNYDCRIYLDLYEKYKRLVDDYFLMRDDSTVLDDTLNEIEIDIFNVKRELDDMYFYNDAIKCYKREHQVV